MGFFDKLFGHATTDDTKPTYKAPRKLAYKRTIDINGPVERTLYTYDPAPVRGIKAGQSFMADVVADDVVIGGRYDTKEWDSTALAVNGQPFAGLATGLGDLKFWARAGIKVQVEVICRGMYDPADGIPELVTMTREPRELCDWWNQIGSKDPSAPFDDDAIAQAAAMHANRNAAASQVRYKERLENELGHKIASEDQLARVYNVQPDLAAKTCRGRSRSVTVTTRLLPVKAGSTAKPHIMLSVDGQDAAELKAQHGAYKVLAANVGGTPSKATLEPRKNDDGTVTYELLVYYGG